jgi:photosystem II stability/assembly factor-like uncharacterized protein
MKPILPAILAATALVALVSCQKQEKPQPSSAGSETRNVWRQGKMGAGGFVSGIDIHPSGQLMVARTDVGGAYKWNEAKAKWVQLASTERLPENTLGFFEYDGVSSIVSAPSDMTRLYMAFCGRIFASDDTGESWRTGTLQGMERLHMEPNARVGRMQGERLAVDPVNRDIAFYGTNKDGLWKTRDGGKSWSRIPLETVPAGVPAQPKNKRAAPEHPGIGSVLFDPSTSKDGKTHRLLATVWGTGVFESTDAGESWQQTGPELGLTSVESAAIANDGTYVIAQRDGKNAFKYQNGEWQQFKLPRNEGWIEAVIKPSDSNIIFLFGPGVIGYARQLRSTDGGETWTQIAHKTLIAEDVPWLAKEAFFSTGAIRFDAKKDRLWIAQGVGVWYSDNALTEKEITWHSQSAGIEELVVNEVLVPEPGQPVIANWDRAIIKSEDVNQYPKTWGPVEEFGSAWDIDMMASNPRSMVGIFQGQANNPHAGVGLSGYSDDGGRTWTPFKFEQFPFDVHDPYVWVYGNIAVSSQDPNKIIWFTVGNEGRLLHTADRGKTWQDSKFDEELKPGSWNSVPYFYKQALVADPLDGDGFYAFNWSNRNLYHSKDGGKSFQVVGQVPSQLGNHHCKLRAVPGSSGHLFFTSGYNNDKQSDEKLGPLFESKDGGKTWSTVPSILKSIDIAFGAPKPGNKHPTYYVNGQATTPDGTDWGIFRSTDQGASWSKIASLYPMGVSKGLSNLAADPGIYGRIYLGSSGIGYFHGDFD